VVENWGVLYSMVRLKVTQEVIDSWKKKISIPVWCD